MFNSTLRASPPLGRQGYPCSSWLHRGGLGLGVHICKTEKTSTIVLSSVILSRYGFRIGFASLETKGCSTRQVLAWPRWMIRWCSTVLLLKWVAHGCTQAGCWVYI